MTSMEAQRRTGYGPFDSDDAADWFSVIAKQIERPVAAAARGNRRRYEEAYAAIWIAIGIERQEPRLFHGPLAAVTPAQVAVAKQHAKERAKGPKGMRSCAVLTLRARKATPDFWKVAGKAARAMANDTGWHASFDRPEAACAGYLYLLTEVRVILRRRRAKREASYDRLVVASAEKKALKRWEEEARAQDPAERAGAGPARRKSRLTVHPGGRISIAPER